MLAGFYARCTQEDAFHLSHILLASCWLDSIRIMEYNQRLQDNANNNKKIPNSIVSAPKMQTERCVSSLSYTARIMFAGFYQNSSVLPTSPGVTCNMKRFTSFKFCSDAFFMFYACVVHHYVKDIRHRASARRRMWELNSKF